MSQESMNVNRDTALTHLACASVGTVLAFAFLFYLVLFY
jgi:hypothetical protein